ALPPAITAVRMNGGEEFLHEVCGEIMGSRALLFHFVHGFQDDELSDIVHQATEERLRFELPSKAKTACPPTRCESRRAGMPPQFLHHLAQRFILGVICRPL